VACDLVDLRDPLHHLRAAVDLDLAQWVIGQSVGQGADGPDDGSPVKPFGFQAGGQPPVIREPYVRPLPLKGLGQEQGIPRGHCDPVACVSGNMPKRIRLIPATGDLRVLARVDCRVCQMVADPPLDVRGSRYGC
jgi:hypothetical protein